MIETLKRPLLIKHYNFSNKRKYRSLNAHGKLNFSDSRSLLRKERNVQFFYCEKNGMFRSLLRKEQNVPFVIKKRTECSVPY